MHQDTKPSKDEGTLTEFHVTERYVVRARTIDEANNMIAENCFDDILRSTVSRKHLVKQLVHFRHSHFDPDFDNR